MRDDENKDDTRAGATGFDESAGSEAEQERRAGAAEAVSQGRDVHDTTRHGTSHGLDVLSDDGAPEIESHGRTVIDRSRHVEARGTDVIDLGPQTSSADEQPDH